MNETQCEGANYEDVVSRVRLSDPHFKLQIEVFIVILNS